MIISGPSGVGKDTVIDAWTGVDPEVVRVVSCTTRKPRPGEVDGVDYIFMETEEFEAQTKNDFFLEYKKVHDKYYGTPLSQVENLLASGKTAILKIDVQGALEVISKRPDAVSVFLLPPSHQELERRLSSRQTENAAELALRLETARKEMEIAPQYDFQIVNETVDETIAQLAHIRSQACAKSS